MLLTQISRSRLVRLHMIRRRLFFTSQSQANTTTVESSAAEAVNLGNLDNGAAFIKEGLTLDDASSAPSGSSRAARRGIVDATLCEKYASFTASKGDGMSDVSALTSSECFDLFLSQCETNSGNQIAMLASRLLEVLKRDEAPECLSYAIKALVRLQQAKVAYPEMLDYVSERVSVLNTSQLADFTSVCYAGGLRSKHHLDIAYRECLSRLSEFDLSQLMRVLRSLSYFSYEYRAVFEKAHGGLKGELTNLSQDDLLMLLNVCKTLHKEGDFMGFRDRILDHILRDIDHYPQRFLLNCLAHLTRGRRTQTGGRFVSQVLQNTKECEREFENMKVTALVPIMQCIELWRIRMSHLTTILNILADRVKEIAYSRNLGLWAEIYNVIYSTWWFSPQFMKAAADHIIAEPQILHRVSSHQLVRVLQTFYKLRFYHKESYRNLLSAIMQDFDGIRGRLNVVCEAVLAAADASIEYPELYEACLNEISTSLADMDLHNCTSPLETLESRNLWPRNVITSTWAFAVMGYQSDPRFTVLLQTLGHPCIYEYKHQQSVILMALEAVESSLVNGNQVELCESLMETYGDAMRSQEERASDILPYDVDPEDSMRDHVDSKITFSQCQEAHFHKGRMRATKHISDILYHLGRRDVLVRVAPHYNSPYLIDICFSNESKKGIVLYSGRELMRDAVEGKWSVVETGSTRLKRYILAKTGWKVVEIGCGEWSQLQNPIDRKQFIRAALENLDITC